MPFASGPQAEHESPRSLRQSALVRVPDERWIEERRRFERILGGEIGADEEPPFLAERFVGKQVPPDAFEAFQEKVVEPLMPALEFAHHVGQKRRHLLGR